ncbi:MAG: hypothetical protein AB8B91_00635 [Rubripirellula sp.]
MKMQNCLLMVAAALMVAPVGCSTLAKNPTAESNDASFFDRLPWVGADKEKDASPEAYPNPVKLAATWTPDTLVQTGRTPTRGFGGRIFFYDEKSRAVPVEGSLIVHGFDDAASKQEDRVKRFEFTPEQFTRHFSQTDLGASYSVWVPWDAIGGTQRRISMVASFKTSEGKLVQGIPATIMLPGKSEHTEEIEMANLSPQYKRYRKAADSPSTRNSGLTTTTITRRRGFSSPTVKSVEKPGLMIPPAESSDAMMASQSPTPSLDVEMLGKRPMSRRASGVMPASAEVPMQR